MTINTDHKHHATIDPKPDGTFIVECIEGKCRRGSSATTVLAPSADRLGAEAIRDAHAKATADGLTGKTAS